LTDEGKTAVFGVGSGGVPAGGEPGTPCLVVYYGRSLGRRHVLDQPEVVVGRSDAAAIQVDQELVSREHARVSVLGGTCRIQDLGSTNGTWVNDRRVEEAELRDGDLVRVGQTVFKYLTGTNIEAKYYEAIYLLSTTDGLTGAANKSSFLDILDRELRRAHRYGRRLSLAIFDIDLFKHVNDTRGHLAGDYVLRELGRLIADHVRQVDTFARYGGEEFALILPEIDRDDARTVCEKLRTLVSEHTFTYDGVVLSITVSFGVATVDACASPGKSDPPPDAARVIAAADGKLYEAKASGRNRVCA
jgi:two-component system cell cycle response regulator